MCVCVCVFFTLNRSCDGGGGRRVKFCCFLLCCVIVVPLNGVFDHFFVVTTRRIIAKLVLYLCLFTWYAYYTSYLVCIII